jgi:D-glycero-alpha-D-manno-heptose-7-phosphate kinase
MIVARTPHRVSLFGGGTDFPSWYLEHGGAVIGGAIDKYCYLTVRQLPPFFDHKYRVVYSKVETVSSPHEIAHPAVRAAIIESGVLDGLEVHHDSDLPARTGIGSSSAFVVGIVQALNALQGARVEADGLASEAIRIEREVLAEVGGHQDQVLCAHGGFRRIDFHQNGDIEVSPNLAIGEDLSRWLVLVYTGTKRNSSEISELFAQRLTARENDSLLMDLAAVTEQASRIFDDRAHLDMHEIGYLMDQSWTIKSRMNPLAVPPDIADLHATAHKAGALGGKISGAGGGGFCVFMVEPDRREYFIERMQPCLVVPFTFVNHGSEIIFHDRGQRWGSHR